MKKSLSLLAIVCLVLSMGLMSQVFANAPIYPEVPSVKLYTNNVGLTPAFDLAWFNTAPDGFNGDKATSYSISTNFLNNSALGSSSFSGVASNVNQGGYSAATDGGNTYTASNAGGTVSVSNKAKYSSYILYELPKVGLNVGESVTVPLSCHTAGNVVANAPSFGNSNALIVSDTTKVSAVWANSNTAVTVTLLASTTSPVYVDVIASPVASGAIGVDQDKARIGVYSNLFANGSFATGNDTTSYGPQTPPGRTTLGSISWLASTTDSASVVATGVLEIGLGNANTGVELTPVTANYLPVTAGKWYISRAKICDSLAGNSDGAFLFSFSVAAAAGLTSDISADVYNTSIPTTWTWLEAPVYVHAVQSGNTFLPQVQFKGGATSGNVFLDEIQVIQATPKILDGTRGNIRSFLSGGLFTAGASTTLWGTQVYFNAGSQPPVSLTSDTSIGSALSANFAGATNVAGSFIGFKWTYGGSGVITSVPVTASHQYGGTMEMNVVTPIAASGGDLSQILIAAYGVLTANSSTSPLDRIDAAAEVGALVPATGTGALATVGIASGLDVNTYVQFGARGDATGILNFSNVDVITDTNDPNMGDIALFP